MAGLDDDLDRILKDYLGKYATTGRAHYLCAEESEHWNHVLGIPAIVTGVGVGSAILGAPSDEAVSVARVILGVLSISAGVITSLQTFFQFSQRARQHRVAGAEYGALMRRIEVLRLRFAPLPGAPAAGTQSDARDSAIREIDTVREKLDEIAQTSPIIPDRVWQLAEDEQSDGFDYQRRIGATARRRIRHMVVATVLPILIILSALLLEAFPGCPPWLSGVCELWAGSAASPRSDLGNSSPSRDGGGGLASGSGGGQFPVGGSATGADRTAQWLETIRDRPPLLRAFLQAMPKGTDLHLHLSGAVYAEHLIAWGAEDKLCVNTTTLEAGACPASDPTPQPSVHLPLAEAMTKPSDYARLVNAWSLRGFPLAVESGHDQFFDTFGRFGAITELRTTELMIAAARTATGENTRYLELMLTVGHDCQDRLLKLLLPADPIDEKTRSKDEMCGLDGSLQGELRQALGRLGPEPTVVRFAEVNALLGQLDLARWGGEALEALNGQLAEVASQLGCADPTTNGCPVTLRFIQQVNRNKPVPDVFLQLAWAFALVAGEGPIVGVNLVAPEDFLAARQGYGTQMRMISWFKDRERHGNTPVALHAGELTLGLVPPEDLRFHIRQAVELGHAQRIGHGVSVGYESDALDLLDLLARRQVAVEISLSSNDSILGVRGAQHPFETYRFFDVPLVITSDDPGISRSDLTHEYELAVESFGLDYESLKALSRNGLTHAFLDDATRSRLMADLKARFITFEATAWPFDRLPGNGSQ